MSFIDSSMSLVSDGRPHPDIYCGYDFKISLFDYYAKPIINDGLISVYIYFIMYGLIKVLSRA